MNPALYGRKAATIWRAMHISAFITTVGIGFAAWRPDAANGIGIMLGSFQLALGGFVSVYSHTQGQVDIAHGPVPRQSGSMPEMGR